MRHNRKVEQELKIPKMVIKKLNFNSLMTILKEEIKSFPDNRIGKNKMYSMEDIVLSAFSVFLTQNPSFLSHQARFQEAHKINNASTIIGVKEIASHQQINKILDTVHPKYLDNIYRKIYHILYLYEIIQQFLVMGKYLLIPADGTGHFSSHKIHCENYTIKKHKDGTLTYFHNVLTPVITHPTLNMVLPLPPEFMLPQDGQKKQDSEMKAFYRWLEKHASMLKEWGVEIVFLLDALYAKQPVIEKILKNDFHYIIVSKIGSNKTLYEQLSLLESSNSIKKIQESREEGIRKIKTITKYYSYDNGLSIRRENSLPVNWCQLKETEKSETDSQEKRKFRIDFITDLPITEKSVSWISKSGRRRWTVENGNNNILKTKGYHFEHNFGHGKKYLSSLLTGMNILAFLFHTILELSDKKYYRAKKTLGVRVGFFNDIKALTSYFVFNNWDDLINTLLIGFQKRFPPPLLK
jgi:hypothetical protein